MTKKRPRRTVEEFLQRPWCYYCERDFDDVRILMLHQKQKHFRCDRCNRRLNTAGGLAVHMSQVHKETLEAIEGAIPTRQAPDIEIFGDIGIPDEVRRQYELRVRQQFAEEEGEHRRATGNPPPGQQAGTNASKRPKFDRDELKKKMAEHRAKKAAEAATRSSGSATPAAASSPGAMPGYGPQGSPPASFAQPYSTTTTYASQPIMYATASYQPQQQMFSQPGFNPASPPPVYGVPPSSLGAPPVASPFSNYGHPGSPPMMGYPPPHTPPVNPVYAQHAPPAPHFAPGLPQRPSFSTPPVNDEQLRQMHQGGAPSSAVAQHSTPGMSATPAGADRPAPDTAAKADEPKGEASTEKKPKKEFRLVYSDNEVSPEEKLARLSRYQYAPPSQDETALGPVESRVTGIVAGPDDVVDRME